MYRKAYAGHKCNARPGLVTTRDRGRRLPRNDGILTLSRMLGPAAPSLLAALTHLACVHYRSDQSGPRLASPNNISSKPSPRTRVRFFSTNRMSHGSRFHLIVPARERQAGWPLRLRRVPRAIDNPPALSFRTEERESVTPEVSSHTFFLALVPSATLGTGVVALTSWVGVSHSPRLDCSTV